MKYFSLLFITFIVATIGNTFYSQNIKYYKSIEGSTDYPVDILGKDEISPSDTLRFRNFYRLTYKNNKIVAVYQSPMSYTSAEKDYVFDTRYEMDQNGYYSKAYYFNKYGKRTSKYSVYYASYKCDSKGNILEITNYDMTGKLHKEWDGTAYIKNKFNDKNQRIEEARYTLDNEFIEGDNSPITKYEYDNNGFVSKISYLNAKGEYYSSYYAPIMKYKNDARGNKIELAYLNDDGTPYYESAYTENEYNDKNQIIRTSEYDVYGALYDGGYGASTEYIYDANGNLIETRVYDAYGLLYTDGTAITKYTFNANGDNIKTEYFNSDNTKSSNYNGIAKYVNEYDNRHNCIEASTYDALGDLVADYNGVATYKYKFDANNYCIETARHGIDGLLVDTEYESAVEKIIYDSKGNILEESNYDAMGDLAADYYSQAAISKYKYDADGNQIEAATYGTDGELIGDYSGIAIERNTYDDRGNIIEKSKFGTDGELYDPYDDGAIVKYKFDANNNNIEIMKFGADGELLKGIACIKRYKYDERGNIIEDASYGDDERLLADYDQVAIYRYVFDENNRVIEEAKYGENDRLLSDEYYGTIATTKYKYDENGNQIERSYFDANEEYVTDYNGVAILRQKYDNQSRVIEKANYNQYQELLNDEYSYEKALVRYKYGNDEEDFWAPIEESTYDSQGALSNLKKYDGYDILEESFYQNNVLKNNEDGIAIIRNEYEEVYVNYGYYDEYSDYSEDYSSEGYYSNLVVRTMNYDQYENFVSGMKFEYDESGYLQFEESINESGKSINNSEGYCRKDVANNIYFNAKGKVIPIQKILAKKVKSYKVVKMDDSGYTVIEEYYNLKGKKVNNDEGYHMYDAINYKYYDKKGREVYYNYDTGLYE
jgi:hypothetical protein